jgi:hypothetical protein
MSPHLAEFTKARKNERSINAWATSNEQDEVERDKDGLLPIIKLAFAKPVLELNHRHCRDSAPVVTLGPSTQ